MTRKVVIVHGQTCVSKCERRIHQLSRGQALLQVIDCRTRKATTWIRLMHNRRSTAECTGTWQTSCMHGGAIWHVIRWQDSRHTGPLERRVSHHNSQMRLQVFCF